eukprot:SAG31_NODE_13741_length_850_cov_0.938748_2_plen_93_part_00
MSANRAALERDGVVVIPGVLDEELLAKITAASNALIESDNTQHLQRDKYTGSLIPISKDATFAELIAHSPTLSALNDLGFATESDPADAIKW